MQRETTSSTDGLWTIVLAAGESRRLGRPKQLLRLGTQTLLTRVARLANLITPGRVVVVLGAQHLRIRRHLRGTAIPISVVMNSRWKQGMSSSLAIGIRHLPRSARAALVMLTDQPLVRREDIARLAMNWITRPGMLIAAAYEKRRGVPAIIPARYFKELRNISGDNGARQLLRSSAAVCTVAMPTAAFDLDTEKDAARLR